MYPDHFNLGSRPFTDGPGGVFVVPNNTVALTAARLQETLLSRDAVAVLSGGPGVGKTALLAHAADGLEDRAIIAWADMRRVEPDQLFDALILALGGQAVGHDGPAAWHGLADRIRHHNEAGRKVTAAIDLNGITAERAKRLLTLVNMSGQPSSQLNVVLMGPHSLHKLLDIPGMIHVRQRIAFRYRVRPLSVAETATYLAERIRAAGGQPDRILASNVASLVYRYVAGVPRLINTLMEASLTAAAGLSRDRVGSELVQQVATGLGWKTMGARPAPQPAPAAPKDVERSAPQGHATPAAAGAAAATGPGQMSGHPSGHAPSEATAALLVAELKPDSEPGTDAGSVKAQQDELTDKLKTVSSEPVDEHSGLPPMSADDPGATGMLRLEDLDERFAESVFGEG